MAKRNRKALSAMKTLNKWRRKKLQSSSGVSTEQEEDPSSGTQGTEGMPPSAPGEYVPLQAPDEELSTFEMPTGSEFHDHSTSKEKLPLCFEGLEELSLPLFITDIAFLLRNVQRLLLHIKRCPRHVCEDPIISCASKNGQLSLGKYGNVIQIKMICSGCLDTFVLSNVQEEENSRLFGLKKKITFPLDTKDIRPLREKAEIHHTKGMGLNSKIVWSSMSCGMGHSQTNEFISLIGLQPMMHSTYKKHEEEVSYAFIKDMAQQMYENAMIEKSLAMEANQIDEEGCPWISVVIDGGWCTRSYGHNYTSKSGCGVIIGSRTGKILYIGVKNKFCFTCLMEERQAKEETDHLCFVNHAGTSSSMEAKIITEGFLFYEEFNLRFLEVIGDDDSNVIHSIRENVPYGRAVTKLLCSNHVIRNFTKRLFQITSNDISRSDKKILTADVKKKMKSFARGSITRCHQLKVSPENLTKQFQSVPKHVLGDHTDCAPKLCESVGSCSPDDKYKDLSAAAKKLLSDYTSFLCEKVGHVMKDVTTNRAENLMSIICRMGMGKIANRTSSRYTSDVMVAGLRQNCGPDWAYISFKNFHKESPRKSAKRLIKRTQSARARTAKYCATKGAKDRRYASKRSLCFKESEAAAYGSLSQKPDKDPQEFEAHRKILFERLAVTKESSQKLQEETVGQASCKLWFLEKKDRLTASNFGIICRMKESTSGIPNITQILYKCNIRTPAMEYGVLNESRAIQQYQRITGNIVIPCGLFVDTEKPFLGASPDGLVDNDGLIEIKCPYSLRSHNPIDPPDSIKSKLCYTIVDPQSCQVKLKRTHHYYYQVQGQLNIANRDWCHFIVYSACGMVMEKIYRDKDFWEVEMLPKLERFYLVGMLPEIVDSRKNRSMPVRELPHVVEMRKKKT